MKYGFSELGCELSEWENISERPRAGILLGSCTITSTAHPAEMSESNGAGLCSRAVRTREGTLDSCARRRRQGRSLKNSLSAT